jgi:PAS domain S-box-containing protein
MRHVSEKESLHKICAQMIGAMTDAVILINPQGIITRTNQATLSLLGFDAEELLDHPVHTILDTDQDRQDGLTAAEMVEKHFLDSVLKSIEGRLLPKEGEPIPISLRSSCVKEVSGEISGVVLVARDLRPTMKLIAEAAMGEAERRKREELQRAYDELKQLQEQLIQSEKMASIGQIAAGVAHEINNPISGIMVYLHTIAKDIENDRLDPEEAMRYLGESRVELVRCSKIIHSLLDFSRQSHPKLTSVDLASILNEEFSILGHKAKLQDIEVVRDIATGLPEILADPDQLKQVFLNLILNAIQAMPRGGRLTIRTALVGDEVEISIEDTGCGIAEENMERLFTPFFTTKEKGDGVGLGLAVAHGIVKRHGGNIKVESTKGKGTTFKVLLNTRAQNPNDGPGLP